MTVVVRQDRPNRRGLIVAALAIAVGLGLLLMYQEGSRTSPEAKKATGAPIADSHATTQVSAPSAAADVPLKAVPQHHSQSAASRPASDWQVSLQPVVVAATRTESLSAYQVQMENWTCEHGQCVGNFRIPPTVEGSHRLSSAADVFDSLKAQMAKQDIDVSLGSVHPGQQGMAVSFQFTPNANVEGRYYTPGEIAGIRLESFEQGVKASTQELNQHPQTSSH